MKGMYVYMCMGMCMCATLCMCPGYPWIVARSFQMRSIRVKQYTSFSDFGDDDSDDESTSARLDYLFCRALWNCIMKLL